MCSHFTQLSQVLGARKRRQVIYHLRVVYHSGYFGRAALQERKKKQKVDARILHNYKKEKQKEKRK